MRRLIMMTFICVANTGNVKAADNTFVEQKAIGSAVSAGNLTPNTPTDSTVSASALSAPDQIVQTFDYSLNLKSDVFGAQLFTGNFAQEGAMQFNPDYMVKIGDQVQVQLWGGYTFDSVLTVDPQGNLFLPQIGPLKVLGVRNHDLQTVIDSAVRGVFRANVYSYASLAAAQPVRVFVGGFVNRPGLYNGTSMDSLLYYLDQAGGIDSERGTFLNVRVNRGEQVRANVNLYDFLFKGQIPLVQLMDGDVIFVPSRQSSIKVSGLVENAKAFEFKDKTISVKDLSDLARPQAFATHVRVTRNKGVIKNIEYYPLLEANNVQIASGDEVEFTADKKPGTITVRIEGEHQSQQEYVMPYGSHFGDLIRQIKFTDRSDPDNVQLFRQSVRDRQKEMLKTSLKTLESSVLTVRSGTTEEALLRKDEADIIMQWVERAKTIEPNGQVVIAQTSNRDELLLEDGDIVNVPKHDGLILVSGEVALPNAIAYTDSLDVEDYIQKAGGYTQNSNSARIVIAHQDGSFDDGSKAALRAGDEVLVLPGIQVKSRQMWLDISQAVYQIAISTRMLTGARSSRSSSGSKSTGTLF
jgi:protein involved in polysaccharide export with SLBB domain